jgi:hypothetical protein
MTYIIKDLTPDQAASFEAWCAAQHVPSDHITHAVAEQSDDDDDEYVPATREEILESLRQGMRDIKLHQAGKLKLKTLKEVIYEIQHSSVAVLQ